MSKQEYYDDKKSRFCCWDWDFDEAISEGSIAQDISYFVLMMSDHPLYCCPFCGSKDFKTNGRLKKESDVK